MCWERTNHFHAFLRREHARRRRGSTPGLQAQCNGTRSNDQGILSTIGADADLRFSLQYCQVTHEALFLVRVLREPLIYLSSCEVYR